MSEVLIKLTIPADPDAQQIHGEDLELAIRSNPKVLDPSFLTYEWGGARMDAVEESLATDIMEFYEEVASEGDYIIVGHDSVYSTKDAVTVLFSAYPKAARPK